MNVTLLLDMAADGFSDRVLVGRRQDGLTAARLRGMSARAAAELRAAGASALIYLAVNGPALPVALFAAAGFWRARSADLHQRDDVGAQGRAAAAPEPGVLRAGHGGVRGRGGGRGGADERAAVPHLSDLERADQRVFRAAAGHAGAVHPRALAGHGPGAGHHACDGGADDAGADHGRRGPGPVGAGAAGAGLWRRADAGAGDRARAGRVAARRVR